MDGQLIFGAFVLHRKPQRLTRDGATVKLRNQALRLLILMAERPGDLITHDDIREHLWAGRHVDFSGGIHLLIREIRQALADDAKQPAYVETIPRQGYRFIGAVESAGQRQEEIGAEHPRTRRVALIGGIVLVLIVAIAATQLSLLLPDADTAEYGKTPESREAYSKGLYLLQQGDLVSLAKAETEFSTAINSDPSHAPAHAGLAAIAIRNKDYDKAELNARKARELDPLHAGTYFHLGIVFMRRDWNWSEAEINIDEAIRLEPENAQYHSVKAMLLTTMGRTEDAIKATDNAYDLDPASALITLDHGWTYLYAGEFELAYEYCTQAVYLNPSNLNGIICQFKASVRTGNFSNANDAAVRIAGLFGAESDLIEEMQQYPPEQGVDLFFDWLSLLLLAENSQPNIAAAGKAVMFAEMNDFDNAFAMISAAAQERSELLPFYLRDPVFWPVANNAHYVGVLEYTGLQAD